jgi:hypothetical protein
MKIKLEKIIKDSLSDNFYDKEPHDQKTELCNIIKILFDLERKDLFEFIEEENN